MSRALIVLVKSIGVMLIGVIGYATLATSVFFVAFTFLRAGSTLDFPWVIDIQRYLYATSWNVWQSSESCVRFRRGLIYEPRIGNCQFDNLEFETQVSFDQFGRSTRKLPQPSGAIAVVGDSFAMGWGVEDSETFSAVLQDELSRQVYNLGVSSYATYRELLRLELSGLLNDVDTVVIQYCNNDLNENRERSWLEEQDDLSVYAEVVNADKISVKPIDFVLDGLWYTLRYPLKTARSQIFWRGGLNDFDNHYDPLIGVLKHYEFLQDKNVIVTYNNPWGSDFRNFPTGKDSSLANLWFIEIPTTRSDYYALDGHLNNKGHQTIGKGLAAAIELLGI